MKTFIHKFSNGAVVRLDFDLSQDMPICRTTHTTLDLREQPDEIFFEYMRWQETVVVPELMNVLTPAQVLNFVKIGKENLSK